MARILLIDDDEGHLEALREAVQTAAGDDGFEVAVWRPVSGTDTNISQEFEKQVGDDTALVVTDYDLTLAVAGFFGTSVVAWCQRLALPVADYSRGNQDLLPAVPDLFEFRLPKSVDEAAGKIVAVAEGFDALRKRLEASPELLGAPSPAAMLARMLDRPSEASSLSLYELQLGAHKGLLEGWMANAQATSRVTLATYMLGHLLFNLVLRYPGPILDLRSVAAYFAIDLAEGHQLTELLKDAAYAGPFHTMDAYFWRDGIDDLVADWAEDSDVEPGEDLAIYRRDLAQEKLKVSLPTHDCERCQGSRGGYICPFTDRVVCEREDCSVGTTSWLPHGAEIARVEKDYYDETAPMLGF
jgi:hypothetical protein